MPISSLAKTLKSTLNNILENDINRCIDDPDSNIIVYQSINNCFKMLIVSNSKFTGMKLQYNLAK